VQVTVPPVCTVLGQDTLTLVIVGAAGVEGVDGRGVAVNPGPHPIG
jgi:hypothetical protein